VISSTCLLKVASELTVVPLPQLVGAVPRGRCRRPFAQDPPSLTGLAQLQRRNFFVIQNHCASASPARAQLAADGTDPAGATAKHFDLRIQLDGGTVSFAILKGLSDFPKRAGHKQTRTGKAESDNRLGIETNVHPIAYTCYEGGGIGITAVWDLGSYRASPESVEGKSSGQADPFAGRRSFRQKPSLSKGRNSSDKDFITPTRPMKRLSGRCSRKTSGRKTFSRKDTITRRSEGCPVDTASPRSL
jgi:hypothetical protein